MGQFEGKIATHWPSEREKIKKGLKIDIEWLCPHAFNCTNIVETRNAEEDTGESLRNREVQEKSTIGPV